MEREPANSGSTTGTSEAIGTPSPPRSSHLPDESATTGTTTSSTSASSPPRVARRPSTTAAASDDEEAKMKRVLANRKSAKESRKRRKKHEEDLQKAVDALEAENTQIQANNAAMRQELVSLLQNSALVGAVPGAQLPWPDNQHPDQGDTNPFLR